MSKRLALVAHWDWVLYQFRMPIARALRDAGVHVTLISPDGPHVSDFRSEGFDWREWQVERRSMNPAREVSSLAALTRTYHRERFDATYHFTAKPCLYGTLAARFTRIPLVMNMFSGLGFIFSGDARATRLRKVLLPLMRWALNRDGVWVLALNEPDMSVLLRSGFAVADRSRLMPEGVDLSRFSVRQRAHPVPIALLACRLLHDKGVPEFVEAADMLATRGVPIRMEIAGDPDEGNPASVTSAELERWKEKSAATFLGQRTDMESVLERSDIAVLPSYHEGLPRFLLEAAASGLPMVATDIPGCRDIVRDGENGFLVPAGDAEALADAVEQLARDPDLRREFGDRAREVVEETFSMRYVVEAHLDLYRDVGLLA